MVHDHLKKMYVTLHKQHFKSILGVESDQIEEFDKKYILMFKIDEEELSDEEEEEEEEKKDRREVKMKEQGEEGKQGQEEENPKTLCEKDPKEEMVKDVADWKGFDLNSDASQQQRGLDGVVVQFSYWTHGL